MEDTVRQIKKRLRLAMNGVASASMRTHGIEYKLNFGASLSSLKSIAEDYPSSVELAERLWSENIRELRILATMLYPVEQFKEPEARRWVSSIRTYELADFCCRNLFQYMEKAPLLAMEWIESSDSMTAYAAVSLLIKLLQRSIVSTEYCLRFIEPLASGVTAQRIPALIVFQCLQQMEESYEEIGISLRIAVPNLFPPAIVAAYMGEN